MGLARRCHEEQGQQRKAEPLPLVNLLFRHFGCGQTKWYHFAGQAWIASHNPGLR